ncbi:Steroid 5-alpha-reductase det2 [Rhizophlyctis rosea]|nr:Steroid 5-alpha-reductase det2 [Rhizophlyctis rosea]
MAVHIESTYTTVLTSIYALSGVTFLLLLKVDPPFGRFSRSGWGPMIPGKVAWAIFETVPIWAMPLFAVRAIGGLTFNRTTGLMLLLWETHYVHRSLIYTYRAPSLSPSTIPVILAGITYNLANAFVNGRALSYFSSPGGPYTNFYLTSPQFLLGSTLFALGMFINITSDNTLFILRQRAQAIKEKKDDNSASGDSDVVRTKDERIYVLPRGGPFHLFNHIACPNYFGELVEWIGWAILTWNLAGLSFAVYSVANLVPRAVRTLEWYKGVFAGRWPKSRRAVVPFLV